jgi:hypothetical protein
MIHIIQKIIKEQNKELLTQISHKYDIPLEEILAKYNTPSFYSIDINTSQAYPILHTSS